MAVTYKLSTIKFGSTGTNVLLVQEILKARGFKGKDGQPLKLDGEAGENTMFAIASYIETRKKQGADLGSPDGWGPKCWGDQNWPKA